MRILMLNYEYPPLGGGAANANYYMLKEFAKKKDLKVDLITSSASNKFEIEDFAPNIHIYKLDVGKKDIHFWTQKEIMKWLYKAHSLSRKLAKKNKYDYCHCWFGFPSGLVGMMLDIPYLVALRGSDVPGFNNRFGIQYIFLKPLIRRIWKKAGKITANSEDLKNLALKAMDIPIHVIPNGVDIDEFKPVKKYYQKKLVSTGRLIPRKGYKYLIHAISIMGDFTLTLVGEGNQQDKLKRMADRPTRRVHFTGSIPHSKIAKQYQKADVFVMPSLNEGLSNSMLEAMACGLPVIVTGTGGAKKLVRGNGIIIEKESSDSIIDALDALDAEKVERMGKKSRKIAEKMSWRAVSKQYLRLYRAYSKQNKAQALALRKRRIE